ncbi:MAG TPA: WYL domain-containing protein [Gemmatimonadaceae bacterium]|jgi:predicted DNA-binding transcriptional regulator YafY|nr:WYL domain-containing protein [Gemmatimonadaceae bacterium]
MIEKNKGSQVENLLRQAGRQRKSVSVTYRYQGEGGAQEHERHWEPYAIRDGHAVVFSYLRNEFRTIPLKHILSVQIRDREFEPRRPIEL